MGDRRFLVVPLADLVKQTVGGGTPSRGVAGFWAGDIPWASVKDFSDEQIDLLRTEESITRAGLASSASNLITPGTPLVCTRMAVGRCAAPSLPTAINQDLKALEPAPGVDSRFLLYAVKHLQPWFETRAVGSTVKGISLRDLLSPSVTKPPIPEQRRIAEILDTLDEAIRKTEQVIAKLQQMKQGLLHDLLTRGIDENGELRDPDRHPDQFKDSPLGRIPREWEVGSLGCWLLGPPRNGYSPVAVDEWTGTLMLGLGCLTVDGFDRRQLKNAPRNDPSLDRALLQPGDLLISRSNTRDLVGLAGVYESVGVPCIYPDLMMRLPPSNTTSSRFLEQLLRSPQVRRQIQAAASGTSGSMVKISGALVRSLLVAMPSIAEQVAILAGLARTKELLAEEMDHAQKLRILKHGLMDDLLTGRVRAPVAADAGCGAQFPRGSAALGATAPAAIQPEGPVAAGAPLPRVKP